MEAITEAEPEKSLDIFDDWKEATMLTAIALQVVQLTTDFFRGMVFQIFNLGSLAMGAYYVNTCKYMQTFKESAEKLEATNLALNEKITRLENAANTLVSTIAKFDTDTAHYLTSLENSIDGLNHAAGAFSRLFHDESLADLWKETLEAVKQFQQAKTEYDKIRIAIQTERKTLEQLHQALSQDERLLAGLYGQYSEKLSEILSRTSQP